MKPKISEASVLEDYECIAYRNMGEYFQNLSKRKLIPKATYSIFYHAMLMLAKDYTITEMNDSKKVVITSSHIFLLCYLMGYIQESSGFDCFYGSNVTISEDIGEGVRTIQRRLQELSEVGFIKVCIDESSYRKIYINFEKIMSEITKIIDPEYNSMDVIKLCRDTVIRFINKNVLLKTQAKEHILYLRMQYLLECSRNKITEPVRFLFTTLAELLGIDFSIVKEDCEAVSRQYIKEVNERTQLNVEI